MSTIEPLALSPAEAAAYLGVSQKTISRLIARGELSARKLGRMVLIDAATVKSFYGSLPVPARLPAGSGA
jgi:excisionase family DNA binding protein